MRSANGARGEIGFASDLPFARGTLVAPAAATERGPPRPKRSASAGVTRNAAATEQAKTAR